MEVFQNRKCEGLIIKINLFRKFCNTDLFLHSFYVITNLPLMYYIRSVYLSQLRLYIVTSPLQTPPMIT